MTWIDHRITKIISEQLNVKLSEVTGHAAFFKDLGADSLETVELVMAFEEEFGIEISDDEAEKILTVQDAIDYVKKKQTSEVQR